MLKFKRSTGSSSDIKNNNTTTTILCENNDNNEQTHDYNNKVNGSHLKVILFYEPQDTVFIPQPVHIPQMNSPALYQRSISLNGTLPPKDYSGHALKKFLIEMKSKNFDDIKLAKYRAAAKLLFVQKATHLHLVDIYNIIEAFRENGLNTLDHSAELDEARLECIVASIYYALYKRLPSTKDIDVERCIVILTQWLMHAYDSGNNGRIRVSSVKTALSALCDGRLVDKFRYVFTQISETNGILVASKLDNYLRELLLLPCAVGEEANFGYTEDILDSFFKPDGPLERTHTKLDDFLDVFLNEASSNVLLWLQMFNKLIQTSTVEHFTQCRGCGKKDFFGLRYKCKQCLNFHLCQECFWRERVAGSHRLEHDVREYTSWSKSERGNTVRKKFLCSPSKSTQQKLPDYPREPEPNKTLDMSNIVPPLPSEPSTPNTTLLRKPRQMSASPSQHSTLSRVSSKLSHDSVSRQDDEHRLITLYAQRLAEHGLNRHTRTRKLSENTYSQPSAEQKEILDSLEEKNRSLLQEIRQLKMKHDEAMKNEQQMGSDPNLLTELRVLRQHKDELELRMSALQETRRELMVQLEGLMKLLKSNQMNSPRQVSRVQSNELSNHVSKSATKMATSGASSTLMRGVNGDVKEAFGSSSGSPASKSNPGGDLRTDLMSAVEEVTSAMKNVVSEVTSTENRSSSFVKEDINKNEILVDMNSPQVSVY